MVLWEITLGTAYFLGLKRTYKLALKIQHRLVKRPQYRQFLHRKTRSIFDAAIKVHREVQQRDIEVGRNLGNWILRWLNKMKPDAQIRKPPPTQSNNNPVKTTTKTQSTEKPPHRYGITYVRNKDRDSSRNFFTLAYPVVPVGINNPHYRQFNTLALKSTRNGVIRTDIMQWMIQKEPGHKPSFY